ncbi:MAG: Phosphatidylserine decarboxylase [Verrucomicrobiaceae bacterium]|nr:Phosphatidylserine decarboxylase [Verrucomicrobiaceae bacterium]
MPASEPILFFNRHTGLLETEAVYGEGFLRWVYENPLGAPALHALVKRDAFSRWYGWRMDQPASAAKIGPFIAAYGLDPASFADPVSSYHSFNDFFYRKLKPSARPIDASPGSVVFPADGRHLLIENIAACADFFVKGARFDLEALLGRPDLARRFAKGSMLISRLCPVDYHRFHFPCAGTPGAPVFLNGPLYSVSPIALKQRPGILWENKRCLTPVRTPDRGEVLFLEIGATCVGTIVHTFSPDQPVAKGDEKGYFRFGGSCVITVYEQGKVAWDADLIENGNAGREVYAWMGERCGVLSP